MRAAQDDAEGWVEDIDKCLETLGSLPDVLGSYELGLLYKIKDALKEKRAAKQALVEQYEILKREEEAEQDTRRACK